MTMTAFAAVRIAKIRDLSHLGRIQSHGKRLDPSSQMRVDPARTEKNIALSGYSPTDPLDLVAAFKERKKRSKASEHGNAKSIGLHALLVLSPSVIAQGGDVHDPDNPMNKKLVAEGQAWAEKEFGEGSVVAVRLDMDEAGSGVLDLVIVPVQERRVNKTRTKKMISVAGALEDVQQRWRRFNGEKSYSCLQTSWAEHARATIRPDIQRGEPIEKTGRQHVHADAYRHAAEAAKEEIAKLQADLEQQLATKDEHIREQAKKGLERGYERGVKIAEERIEAALARIKDGIADGEIVDAATHQELGAEWQDHGPELGVIQPQFALEVSPARRERVVSEIRPVWTLVSAAVASSFEWAREAGKDVSSAVSRLGW